jgi:hypothetical protein
MPRRLFAFAAAFATALLAATGAGAAGFSGLNPGGLSDLREEVPVNVVFVGFGDDIDESTFLGELPETYVPVVRSRLWYGNVEELGLNYTYDYNVVHADAAYEDALFEALSALAKPAPLTSFQEFYNESGANILDVEDNHFIDAPSVERWLIKNPPSGVDPTRNTVVFINWWGRDDFKFHVYTKIGEPDPDTGYDFGLNRESRKIVAWGGTAPADEETGYHGKPARVWFYDLSAGPEAWNGNYDLVDEDLDGDGIPDYRIPTSWEYDPAGYRSPDAMSSDLGKVTRFVGLNLLMTTSPLYPPYLTPTKLPGTINLDSNTYEGWPGTNASAEYIKPDLLVSETQELIHNRTTYDSQKLPFQGKAEECFLGWLFEDPFGPNCYAPDYPFYTAAADPFLDTALKRPALIGGAQGDYEALAVNYATGEDFPTPLGFADDNWVDGTQSFIFNFISPGIVEVGYGLTTTQIHEFGHHWGMSHPHDGWDSEGGFDYGPSADLFFAWSGDESNSMMSYIDLNWDFSQFDQDNHNRHRAGGYMMVANDLAAKVLAKPGSFSAKLVLTVADGFCALGKLRLANHDYEGTFQSAKQCYDLSRLAAQIAGVPVVASPIGWTVLGSAGAAGVRPSTKLQHGYSFDRSRTGLDKRLLP